MHQGMSLEEGIISQSILYRSIYWLISKFNTLYRYSGTHRILVKMSETLKSCFDGSGLWRFIRRDEKCGKFFEYSIFYKVIQSVINLFIIGARKLASICSAWYESSILYRLLDKLVSRFELLIGTVILIHTVIPHQRWHNQYTLVLVFCTALLYFIKLVHDRSSSLDIKKVDFALIVFGLSVLFAAATSIAPRASLRSFTFYAVMFLMVLIMVNSLKTEEQIKSLMHVIIAGVTLASVYGIWQYANNIQVDPRMVDVRFSKGVRRVFSTMGNPNDYAAYLILTIPYFITAFLQSKSRKVKFILAAFTALVLVNLVLTSTRAAWIAFVIATFVYVFLKNRKLIPLLVLVGIAALPFIPESIMMRIRYVGKDSSSLYRIKIWKSSLGMLKDYWVTGIGLGPEAVMGLFANYSQIQTPAHSHMLPIEIWLEMGLLGIMSFIWFVARIVKKGCITIFNTKNAFANNLIAASVASYAAILAMGLTDYVWFYPRTMNMFWFNTGIFLAAINLASSGVCKSSACHDTRICK